MRASQEGLVGQRDDPRRIGRHVPRDGWQVRGLYAGAFASDVDPKVAHTIAPWRGRERPDQLARPEPELLGHDRCIGLDIDHEAGQAHDPAGAGRRRDAFCHERLERRDRPSQTKLVLETKGAGRIGDEVADPAHRSAPGRRHGSRPAATRTAPASRSARTSQP
jgi:hypothetical protein